MSGDPMLEYYRQQIKDASDIVELKAAVLEWFDHCHPEVTAPEPEPVRKRLDTEDNLHKLRVRTNCSFKTAQDILSRSDTIDLDHAVQRVVGLQRKNGYRQ